MADQVSLPGCEPITERELAERRMQGRKRSTAKQRPVDGLELFDPSARAVAQRNILGG